MQHCKNSFNYHHRPHNLCIATHIFTSVQIRSAHHHNYNHPLIVSAAPNPFDYYPYNHQHHYEKNMCKSMFLP